ncbi:MAG: hypothetical protein Q9168_006061 [Polycauliona sp. 1 TL-2023]
MQNTILPIDLLRAERALAALADDPEQLDRARQRFSASPPFRKSPTPGSTRSQSSTPPTPGQVQRRREISILCRRQFSRPARQLSIQTGDQYHRFLRLCNVQTELPNRLPAHADHRVLAREMVKKQWREQGIWNDKWDQESNVKDWRWKHEEPGIASDLGPDPDFCPHNSSERQPTQSPPSGDELKRPLPSSEQQAMATRDREASRPFYQFLWQLNRQRDLMNGEPTIQRAATISPVDTNAKAYEVVKELWDRHSIWDAEWGIMPGMSWMHERPPDWTLHPALGLTDAQKHLFAINEIEAEAQRLFPKPPSPPRRPSTNLPSGEYHRDEHFSRLFGPDLKIVPQWSVDGDGEANHEAESPKDQNADGPAERESGPARRESSPQKDLFSVPTNPAPLQEDENKPLVEGTACYGHHPLDDDPEYQREVDLLMDPFNVLDLKYIPRPRTPRPRIPTTSPEPVPFVGRTGLFGGDGPLDSAGRARVEEQMAIYHKLYPKDPMGSVDMDRIEEPIAALSPEPFKATESFSTGGRGSLDAAASMECHPHEYNTGLKTPKASHEAPQDQVNDTISQDRLNRSLPPPTRGKRAAGRGKTQGPSQQDQGRADQSHDGAQMSSGKRTRAKRVLSAVHNDTAAELSMSDQQAAIDTVAEAEHEGSRRRSKRLRRDVGQDKDVDDLKTNDERPSTSKRVQRRKGNIAAESVKDEGVGGVIGSEADQNTSVHEEKKSGGANIRPRRATATRKRNTRASRARAGND